LPPCCPCLTAFRPLFPASRCPPRSGSSSRSPRPARAVGVRSTGGSGCWRSAPQSVCARSRWRTVPQARCLQRQCPRSPASSLPAGCRRAGTAEPAPCCRCDSRAQWALVERLHRRAGDLFHDYLLVYDLAVNRLELRDLHGYAVIGRFHRPFPFPLLSDLYQIHWHHYSPVCSTVITLSQVISSPLIPKGAKSWPYST